MTTRPRTAVLHRLALAGLACSSMHLLLGGCASEARIDRDIRALIREQNERLREELAEPASQPLGPDRATRNQLDKQPPTNNPTAAELNYLAAPADEDVRARLQRLLTDSRALPERLLSDGPAAGASPDNSAPQTSTASLEVLALEDALHHSQRTGREFLTAQEDYLLAAIRLLQERHLWGPRLFNDTTLALSDNLNDGRTDPALSLINSLRATQRLPSGGELEARWVWNAAEQLREQSTGTYIQSSEIILRGDVPLLRGAGSIAREDLIQAERDLVYQSRTFERFRREYLVDIAQDYFALLETRARIINQIRQLQSLSQFDRATRARVDAGRLEAFQTAITENRLRSAESSLEGLRDAYVLQLERFKVRIGLPVDQQFDLSDDLFALPEPDAELQAAVSTALALRLDVQNSADRLEDSKRAVANAKDGILPDLDLFGEVGVPTDPDDNTGGVAFDNDETAYRVGATLSMPLDRERERLAVRATQIRLERATREHQRLQDNVAVSARGAVRAVPLARFQLDLAEQQVEINRRRLRAQKLQEDAVDPQQIVDTENDLLDAENARDRAKTRLRTAILGYLLETDQLRVTREGTLQVLPGM